MTTKTQTNGQAPETDAPERPRLKARLVSITVALEIVADDGEHLHLIDTQPLRLAANGWATFHPEAALAEVEEQINR